jgi:hypothetical protein
MGCLKYFQCAMENDNKGETEFSILPDMLLMSSVLVTVGTVIIFFAFFFQIALGIVVNCGSLCLAGNCNDDFQFPLSWKPIGSRYHWTVERNGHIFAIEIKMNFSKQKENHG